MVSFTANTVTYETGRTTKIITANVMSIAEIALFPRTKRANLSWTG